MISWKKMGKRKISVGVTGLNAIDSPGPGIPVIRALKESRSFDARIVGFAYESLEPGIYMHDLVDKVYHIPYPSAGTDALLSRLEYIQDIEKLDVIIPNFDAELYPFQRIEKPLLEMGIRMYLPTVHQFEERLKVNLEKFGKKHGIEVPKDTILYDTRSLFSSGSGLNYPLLVKGKYYDATVVKNAEQAKSAFEKISAKWGLPIILQEFIHGTEYNVTGLGDGKGNMIAAVPMRKQYITDKGKAWGGITIADENLLDLTRKFLKATKWRGGFELELIKTEENKLCLLEINPRLPAWIYLAVGAGQNIPEALVKLALGLNVKPFQKYDVGKMFIRYSWDMIVNREEFEKISIFGEL
jgi:carbamoyl-phosphate synthase large subunit